MGKQDWGDGWEERNQKAQRRIGQAFKKEISSLKQTLLEDRKPEDTL